MLRCVNRWNLAAPFDSSVSESQWEAYYKERAALDYFYASNGGKGCPKDDDSDDTNNEEESANPSETLGMPKWTEDFPLVSMRPYPRDNEMSDEIDFDGVQDHTDAVRAAVANVIKGCPQLNGITPELMESCVYFIGGEINWAGETTPRGVDYNVRMYSPCGLGTSLELNVTWHRRSRMYFAEHFGGIQIDVRGPDERHPEAPVAEFARGKWLHLCQMSEEDSGYQDRSLSKANKLRDLEKVLFGRRKSLSEVKVGYILIVSSGDRSRLF